MLPILMISSSVLLGSSVNAEPPPVWGEHGHRLVGRAAVEALPAEMPEFFRVAAAQLEYLNVEPDRWRDRVERSLDSAMDGAHAPEHYINFERLPARARIRPEDVREAMVSPVRVLDEPRAAVVEFLRRSHGEVERLYALDNEERFGARTTAESHRRFTAERLAAGAEMLRDLWWTAWVTSAEGTRASD